MELQKKTTKDLSHQRTTTSSRKESEQPRATQGIHGLRRAGPAALSSIPCCLKRTVRACLGFRGQVQPIIQEHGPW